MPPRKPVRSLYDIARSATCQLVLSASINIQELYPNRGQDLNFCCLTKPRQQTVNTVQDFLRVNLPFTVFEDLFHAILDQDKIREIFDMRILYSIFIYNNIALRKLRLTDIINYRLGCFVYESSRLPLHSRVQFWLNHAPMLSRLVVVDLTHVSSDDILLAFCRSCPGLTIMNIGQVSCSETLAFVYRSCTQLRKLVHQPLYAQVLIDALTSLDTNHKLKLRNVSLKYETVTPEQMQVVIERCPDLKDLTLSRDSSSTVMLQILADSPLKLTRLCVYNLHLSAVHIYFSCKGEHITVLDITPRRSSNPLEILAVISEKCHHLMELVVDSVWTPNGEEEQKWYGISFPKLEHLEVRNNSVRIDGLITLVNYCIKDAENVTKLAFLWSKDVFSEATPGWKGKFIQFFTTNQRVSQLETLTLWTPLAMFSTELVNLVYNTCTNLTSFKVSGLNDEAEKYFYDFKGEVKFKNLNVEVDSFKQRRYSFE